MMNFIRRTVEEFRTDKPTSPKADRVRTLLGMGLTLQQVVDEVNLTLSQVQDILFWMNEPKKEPGTRPSKKGN